MRREHSIAATRQGEKYFADATVYVERYLEDPRHVEVQVLADAHGNVVHLGERDCTIQRRHQKLVEETPSPAVDEALRARIGAIAVDAARAAGYRSAGTIEGLLTPAGDYFFMEMNTRIQVEHTVTEAVTGLDLVREQVLVAAGEPLSVTQDEIALRGHAIECRINAEDVQAGFLPAPGRITAYSEPAGPGVRVDSGVEAGDEVSGLYDPMIAKLIVHDVDRERATARMLRALAEFKIEGPPTLLGFHRALLEHPCFVAGGTCAGVIESTELAARVEQLEQTFSHGTTSVPGGADGAIPTVPRLAGVEVDGRVYEVRLEVTEPPWAALARARRERGAAGGGGAADGAVTSPMQGTVLTVEVAEGDEVTTGQLLCVVEAMKMENESSPRASGRSETSPWRPGRRSRAVNSSVAWSRTRDVARYRQARGRCRPRARRLFTARRSHTTTRTAGRRGPGRRDAVPGRVDARHAADVTVVTLIVGNGR